MDDDAKRWDIVHRKTYSEAKGPSAYAIEKEKLFPRGSLIVELGGGTGEDALYFLQKGHSVIVLDISEFALKVAQEQAKKSGFEKRLVVRQVDFGLHELPIKPASIDVAYSRISLNYFDAQHTTKLFQDIYKMLKPGGKVFLTFKSSEDKQEMEYLQNTATLFEPNVYIENGQLRSRFTAEQLKTMLVNAAISEYQVNPYKEELGQSKEAGHRTLILNEIIFTKTS